MRKHRLRLHTMLAALTNRLIDRTHYFVVKPYGCWHYFGKQMHWVQITWCTSVISTTQRRSMVGCSNWLIVRMLTSLSSVAGGFLSFLSAFRCSSKGKALTFWSVEIGNSRILVSEVLSKRCKSHNWKHTICVYSLKITSPIYDFDTGL